METVQEVVASLYLMIEECQQEARYAVNNTDRLCLLAKRDALDEIRMRIRNGKQDPHWARRVPTIVTGTAF